MYFFQNSLHRLLFWIIDHLLLCVPKTKRGAREPQKILLSQLAHLGDLLLTLPLIQELKRAYPKATIGIVVGSWNAHALLQQYVDEIFIIDHWKCNRSSLSFFQKVRLFMKTKKKAYAELKQKKYDLVLLCSLYFPNLAPFYYRLKIPSRMGYRNCGFGPLLTKGLIGVRENRSIASYYFELMGLETSSESAATESAPLARRDRYIILHMGVGDPSRAWPQTCWKELAQKLHNKGYLLYFTGKGEREKKAIVNVIEKGMENGMIDLSDQLSVDGLSELVKNAALIIAGDTGISHLAALHKRPSIALFTHIYPLKLWAPLNSHCTLLVHPTPCAPCFRPDGCPSMHCIKGIGVEKVFGLALEKLALFQDQDSIGKRESGEAMCHHQDSLSSL